MKAKEEQITSVAVFTFGGEYQSHSYENFELPEGSSCACHTFSGSPEECESFVNQYIPDID